MDSIPEAQHAFTKDAEVILDARKQLLRGYEGNHALLTPEELDFIKTRAASEMKRNLVYPLTGLILTSFSIHTVLRRFTNFGPARIGMISFASATTVFALSSSYGAVANYKDLASGLLKLQNSPIAERTIYTLETQFPNSTLLEEVPNSKKKAIENKIATQPKRAIPLPPPKPKSVQQQTEEFQKTQKIIYDTLLEMYNHQTALTREEKDFFSGMSTTILWRGVAMPLGLGLLSFFAMRGILRWLTQWQPRTIDLAAASWSAFSITTEAFGAATSITNQAAEGLFQLDNSPKADQAYTRLLKECPDVPLLRKYPRDPRAAAAKRDPGSESDPFQTDLSKYAMTDFSFKPALVHYDSKQETPGLTFMKEEEFSSGNTIQEQQEEEPAEYESNEDYYQDDTYEEDDSYPQPKQTNQPRFQDDKTKSFEARQRAIHNYKRKQSPPEED